MPQDHTDAKQIVSSIRELLHAMYTNYDELYRDYEKQGRQLLEEQLKNEQLRKPPEEDAALKQILARLQKIETSVQQSNTDIKATVDGLKPREGADDELLSKLTEAIRSEGLQPTQIQNGAARALDVKLPEMLPEILDKALPAILQREIPKLVKPEPKTQVIEVSHQSQVQGPKPAGPMPGNGAAALPNYGSQPQQREGSVVIEADKLQEWIQLLDELQSSVGQDSYTENTRKADKKKISKIILELTNLQTECPKNMRR